MKSKKLSVEDIREIKSRGYKIYRYVPKSILEGASITSPRNWAETVCSFVDWLFEESSKYDDDELYSELYAFYIYKFQVGNFDEDVIIYWADKIYKIICPLLENYYYSDNTPFFSNDSQYRFFKKIITVILETKIGYSYINENQWIKSKREEFEHFSKMKSTVKI